MKQKLKPTLPKRTYPERRCLNPECLTGGQFTPHRKNQLYCCEHCRRTANNDRRSLENNTIFADVKILKATDQALLKLYENYANREGYCRIPDYILDHEGIDHTMLVRLMESPNAKGGRTHQFFRFAIEPHPDDNKYYIIYKIQQKCIN